MDSNPYSSPESDVLASTDSSIALGELKASQIPFKEIFRTICWGLIYSFGPLFLVLGTYDLIVGNESWYTFNESKLTGIAKYLTGWLFVPIWSFLIALFVSGLVFVGLKIQSLRGGLILKVGK